MEKMKFETPDMTQMNIEKIAALFPNCITEKKDDSGKITKAVNFDALKQILGDSIADGDESYEFTWVGKRDAMPSSSGQNVRFQLIKSGRKGDIHVQKKYRYNPQRFIS